MARPSSSVPGADPILEAEAQILEGLIDTKVETGKPVTLARVFYGCDGLRHVQLPNAVRCCETCDTAPGSLVPIYSSGGITGPITGDVPFVHSGTAGQPTITSGSFTTPTPCNPTPIERVAARRLQDSIGNLWNGQTGAWISAGHGAPALVASYAYTSIAAEIISAKIKESDGSPEKNILTEVPTDRRCGARPPGRSFSYAVRDYALRGICALGSCGRIPMTDYVCGIEWFLDTDDPNPQVMTGPVTVVRRFSDLSIVASYTIGSLSYTNSGGQDWAIDVADDGTWIVHQIPIASGGSATVDVHRFAFTGSSISYLGAVRITNDNAGGKAAAVTGLYFKQVV